MNIFIKSVIVTIILAMFAQSNIAGFAYFQDSFHCTIDRSALKIASNPFEGSRLCLQLVGQLKDRRSEIVSQIDWLKVQNVSAYNSSVIVTLNRQRTDINKLNTQIISGINNLEARIFTNNKKKYFLQLRSIRIRLLTKQAILSADLASSIADGELNLVTKIIATIGFNYQRIKLIEGILSSKSLDEMMPLWNIYKGLIESQVTGK